MEGIRELINSLNIDKILSGKDREALHDFVYRGVRGDGRGVYALCYLRFYFYKNMLIETVGKQRLKRRLFSDVRSKKLRKVLVILIRNPRFKAKDLAQKFGYTDTGLRSSVSGWIGRRMKDPLLVDLIESLDVVLYGRSKKGR